MKKMLPGFQGKDAMREKAKKILGNQMRENMEPTYSSSAMGRTHIRPYKKGGKVHKLTKEQTDLHLPKMCKTPKNKQQLMSKADHFKKGGKVKSERHKNMHKFADGGIADLANKARSSVAGVADLANKARSSAEGFLNKGRSSIEGVLNRGRDLYKNARNSIPNVSESIRGVRSAIGLKKGGKACMKREKHASGGSVYEKEMVGNHPNNKAPHFNYSSQMNGEKPSHRRAYAAGGSGKIRHHEATHKGKPMKAPRSRGR